MLVCELLWFTNWLCPDRWVQYRKGIVSHDTHMHIIVEKEHKALYFYNACNIVSTNGIRAFIYFLYSYWSMLSAKHCEIARFMFLLSLSSIPIASIARSLPFVMYLYRYLAAVGKVHFSMLMWQLYLRLRNGLYWTIPLLSTVRPVFWQMVCQPPSSGLIHSALTSHYHMKLVSFRSWKCYN